MDQNNGLEEILILPPEVEFENAEPDTPDLDSALGNAPHMNGACRKKPTWITT